VGDDAQLGTRDYAGGGYGDIVDGKGVVADSSRELLDGKAMLDLVGADGDGHGVSHTDHSDGKAFHAFDVDGAPITFLVLDTNHHVGGAEGVITQRDVD